MKAKYKRGDYFKSKVQGNIVVITRYKKCRQFFIETYRYYFKKPTDKYGKEGSFIHEKDIDNYWIKLGDGARVLYEK